MQAKVTVTVQFVDEQGWIQTGTQEAAVTMTPDAADAAKDVTVPGGYAYAVACTGVAQVEANIAQLTGRTADGSGTGGI